MASELYWGGRILAILLVFPTSSSPSKLYTYKEARGETELLSIFLTGAHKVALHADAVVAVEKPSFKALKRLYSITLMS
jgi:hypothetical protein